MYWIVFRVGKRVFRLARYYGYGLILRIMIGYYTQVVFLIYFVMKKFRTCISVLSGRRMFGFASYYDLRLVFGTMIGHYTQVIF